MATFTSIAVFDIVGPIVVQNVMSSHGFSQIVALIAAGGPPTISVLFSAARHRRMDVIGAFVLSSIVLATLIGLGTGSAKLYLLDGAILTGVFGVICLASLLTGRPLMYHLALASNGGPDTAKGKAFADRWVYPGFRRTFVVMTVVWGLGFVAQAAISATIVEVTSTNRAFLINKILPYVALGLLGAWTCVYGFRAKRRGEAMAAAERGEA